MGDPNEEVSEEEAKIQAECYAERFRLLRLESRLGLPFAIRLPVATTLSFVVGAGLGISYGTTTAAMRFRAENAHRLPTTSTGWYLYHKSKNYVTALGGLKEGLKMGTRVSIWTAGFFTVENLFDKWRGKKDFINTLGGTLAMAGCFSFWNQFPIKTAATTAKSALVIGLAYGLAQDILRAAKGRQLDYVDFVHRCSRPKVEVSEDLQKSQK